MQRSNFARRGLLAVAVLALLWAGVITLTGGFRTQVVGVRISSSNARNPLLLALLATGGVLLLSGSARRRILTEDLQWWRAGATAAYRVAVAVWPSRWVNPTTIAAAGGATLLLYQWARARPLWLDEEMIALNIRDRSLLELARPLWLDQSAPFGWLATQRIATLAFGFNEASLRFVPVAFGVAAIGAAAWVGRRWMTRTGAVALVLLFSMGQWIFHYSLELKHYSGDVLFGLMLPALVVWAIEADGPDHRLRRAGVWWIVAALAQWWAFGALFVTPACAVILCLALWRLDGRRSAVRFAVFGAGWLASFGLHYFMALRFAFESDALREYWSAWMPPLSATAAETVSWFAGRLVPLADRPGGTQFAALFWTTALLGFLLARRRVFSWVFAAVPASACVLAAMRLVPLFERQSLWAVAALYVGIALSVEAGARGVRDAYAQARPLRGAVAAVVLIAGTWLCLDIVQNGWRDSRFARPPDSNHQLDDRTGVRWLVAQQRPGDAVLTTFFALPAVWWYGQVRLSSPSAGGALPDGSPIFEVSYRTAANACDDGGLDEAMASRRRILVYFGFRFDDVPRGFDELLTQELERIGHVAEFRRFSETTGAAVLEVDPVREPRATRDADPTDSTHLTGCLSVRPASAENRRPDPVDSLSR